jgi:hypothetical protein
MTKMTQNSISFAHWISKLQNHLHKVLFIEGFSRTLRVHPNFPQYFSFDSIEISMTTLFNIQ